MLSNFEYKLSPNEDQTLWSIKSSLFSILIEWLIISIVYFFGELITVLNISDFKRCTYYLLVIQKIQFNYKIEQSCLDDTTVESMSYEMSQTNVI